MKAILTGHTRGLGAAIAETLLTRNIPVLGLARGRNRDLEDRFPLVLEQVEIDLADPAAFTHWLDGDRLHRFLSGCDTVLLINNAGMLQPIGPLDQQDASAIARACGLNVATPLMLSHAVAACAGPRERRIVHISSGAARNAYAGWSVYCATKAALDHHARAVALDQSSGLRICSLAPGVVDTDMQAEIRATDHARFPQRERFEALKRDGHLTDPHDCAHHLVDYLLGEHFGQEPVVDLRNLPVTQTS